MVCNLLCFVVLVELIQLQLADVAVQNLHSLESIVKPEAVNGFFQHVGRRGVAFRDHYAHVSAPAELNELRVDPVGELLLARNPVVRTRVKAPKHLDQLREACVS
jgi:hypothetical protein